MSAADDVQRLLVLVPWLLERPGAHVAEIADVFHTSADQIRRDLALLDFCGLPGLRGGDLFDVTVINDRATIDLADELRRPLRPTENEAIRLVLHVDAVRIALGDTVPALTSASAKLRAMLSLPTERLGLVDDTAATHPLHLLRTAITDDRQVTFSYLGRNDVSPKHRHVDPIRMHVLDGNWYLEAFDRERNAGRIFHTERISDVTVGVAPRDHRDLASQYPAYQPRDDDETVELVIQKPGLWILDHLNVHEEHVLDNGSTLVQLTTDALPYIARLVLMARGTVTVTKPDSLRSLVCSLAQDALMQYGLQETEQ